MAASDHLSDVQFTSRTRKDSKGIRATTISARRGDRTLGYAKVTDGGSFLDTVYVRPEARGSGLGHSLVSKVTDKFGSRTLRLHASAFGGDGPDTSALMSFYGKHGFEAEGGGDTYMSRRPTARE